MTVDILGKGDVDILDVIVSKETWNRYSKEGLNSLSLVSLLLTRIDEHTWANPFMHNVVK